MSTAKQRFLDLSLLLFLSLTLLLVSGCSSEGEQADEVGAEITETVTAPAGSDTDESITPPNQETVGGFAFTAESSFSAKPSAQSSILPGLEVTDFVVVSTRRTGRTTMEYVLKLKISNGSPTFYKDVVATLQSTPQHIAIIDGIAIIGEVPPNSTILSQGTFTLDVNLAISTSFDEIVWLIEGDVDTPPPQPPPTSGSGSPGIYMNIDDLRIRGESKSALHKDWIEVTSLMEGLRLEGVPSSGQSRRRTGFEFDNLNLRKFFDRATVKLREAIAKGTIFTEVQIDVVASCDGNAITFLAFTLSIARLEALESEASGSEDTVPFEDLSFNYTRITTMYAPIEKDCTIGTPLYSTQDGEVLDL